MKTLADFPNQVHITSVLRAALIKQELAPFYILAGGSVAEREELRTAFYEAYRCLKIMHPINKGVPCGVCFNCVNKVAALCFTQIFSVSDLGEIEEDTLAQATVFQLHNSQPALEPRYLATTALLLVLLRKPVEDVLAAVTEFSATYSYQELTDSLLYVLRDSLAIKHGVEVAGVNKGTRYIAHALSHYYFVQLMSKIWDAQERSVVDDVLVAQTLCLFLSNIIKPALPKPLETPITIVEEPTPMSFEDMLSWVKET